MGLQLRCRGGFERTLEDDDIWVLRSHQQHSDTCSHISRIDAFVIDDEEKCHRQGELSIRVNEGTCMIVCSYAGC